MKVKTTYLLFTLLLLTAVSCKHHQRDTDQLSDKEKLEILDFKIEKNPKNSEAYAERSQVLFNLGRVNEAISDITKAVELDPKNVDYRLREADMWFASGNIEKSYHALSEAEKMDPESLEVQLKMGEVTFYARDYDRSIQCLSKVTAKEPDNRTALFMKGFIYKEKGDTASAVTLLRKVGDLYPDYAPAFEELGVLYASVGDPLAEEYLETTLRLQPNNTNAMYALAMFHQEHGDMEKAEELYRRMLDINENSADAWHNLGYIELTHYHDYARAIEYFDHALEADPQHSQALANRQLAMEQINK